MTIRYVFQVTHHVFTFHVFTFHVSRMIGGNYLELLETRFKNWSSCKTRPVPSATALNGSSAIWTGKPVSSATRRSMPRNNAPPPAMTMPRSTRSADNSGGQRSRVMRTDSKILDSGSCKASRISSERMVRVFGNPALKSRPLTSIVSSCSSGILNGLFFHFGDARGHGDDYPRRNQFPMMNFLDEVAEHRFGDFEISDDAILHGPNSHDISRRASEHPFGFFAYGQDVSGARLNRYHGRVSQNKFPLAHG